MDVESLPFANTGGKVMCYKLAATIVDYDFAVHVKRMYHEWNWEGCDELL